jgi:AcrR family transcriptional regulator
MNKTKNTIFEAAIKVFSSNGYNGATMDDIALNAGVAKGTLYYHFKSKKKFLSI